MNWGRAAALGFGVFKTTDLLKELFDRATGLTPRPYLKSSVSMILAGAVAVAYEEGWKDRVLLASAVAGSSAVLHEGYEVLSTRADVHKLTVMRNLPVSTARANAPSNGGPGRRMPAL